MYYLSERQLTRHGNEGLEMLAYVQQLALEEQVRWSEGRAAEREGRRRVRRCAGAYRANVGVKKGDEERRDARGGELPMAWSLRASGSPF